MRTYFGQNRSLYCVSCRSNRAAPKFSRSRSQKLENPHVLFTKYLNNRVLSSKYIYSLPGSNAGIVYSSAISHSPFESSTLNCMFSKQQLHKKQTPAKIKFLIVQTLLFPFSLPFNTKKYSSTPNNAIVNNQHPLQIKTPLSSLPPAILLRRLLKNKSTILLLPICCASNSCAPPLIVGPMRPAPSVP